MQRWLGCRTSAAKPALNSARPGRKFAQCAWRLPSMREWDRWAALEQEPTAGSANDLDAAMAAVPHAAHATAAERDAWAAALGAASMDAVGDADSRCQTGAPAAATAAGRPPPQPSMCAVVECGSHATRLLVSDGSSELERLTLDTALGRCGCSETSTSADGGGGGGSTGGAGNLNAAGVQATLAALHSFRQHLERHHVSRVRAVATAAVRECGDGTAVAAFLHQAQQALGGVPVEVLSGDAEGALAFQGATAGLSGRQAAHPCLCVDLGGRSTELAWGLPGQAPSLVASLRLGCVGVQAAAVAASSSTGGRRRSSSSGDAMGAVITAARGALECALAAPEAQQLPAIMQAAARASGGVNGLRIVATGGTVTTAAALLLRLPAYDHAAVHHSSVTRADLLQLARELASEAGRGAALRRFSWLTPERASSLSAGCAALVVLLDMLLGDGDGCCGGAAAAQALLVADTDLLDGVLAGLLMEGQTMPVASPEAGVL